MTKVSIVSGFLGAGKTTFIKELISKVFQAEKVVLIENEFGEIGVDSRFMQNTGVEVTEMNSGCICCTLVGDFTRSLQQAVEQFQPDRVIIEPSGVGKLSDVANAVKQLQGTVPVEIDSRITVVDGKKARMFMKNFGEFFNNQVEHATTIVVSRTQIMTEARLKECLTLLQDHNQEATIITTPWEQLSGNMILDALKHGRGLEKELMAEHLHHHEQPDYHHHDKICTCGHEHHDHHHHHNEHHHADEIFDSWGLETVHKFKRQELENILNNLNDESSAGTVLRAKGIVESDDGQWFEFDMVPDESDLRKCEPDYIGRICVIGTALNTEYLERVFG